MDISNLLEFGQAASAFSEKWLKEHDYEVFTKHEDARGSGKTKRRYAMIQDKDSGEFLSQALIEAGLARVYGKETELPNGRSANKYWSDLRRAEKEAKEARRGAWAASKQEEDNASKGRAALLPAGLPELPAEATEKTIVRYTLVYSLLDGRPRGRLNPGMKITLLGPADDPGMVRIRFSPSPDKLYEAQCKKSDLGYR